MNPNVIQFCCFALDDKCEFANICIENGIDVRYDEEMRNVPKNSTKYAWEKCCEKCYERENAGLRQRGPINLYFNETNGGEKENIGSKRKRRGEKTRVQKVSGCALCEKKESSQWYKNTETGETDICITCYSKRRAVEIAPPNGCALCEKKESSQWLKKYRYGRKRYL